jgi:hypothetical protein
MTDANRKLLESSILEPMPPFRSVDDVIGGERRRQRLRRGAGALVAAAAVVGIVFGIQAGVGKTPALGPTAQPGQSGSGGTSAPPPSRTIQDTDDRLVIALLEALSTVGPGGSTATFGITERIDSYPGYTGFSKSGTLTTSQGVGAIKLVVLWPETGVPPSNDELAGVLGCRGPLLAPTPFPTSVNANCEVHITPMGPVALAQDGDGVNHAFTVATSYSDSAHVAMTAWNNPAAGLTTPVLTLDQLRRIVTDPEMRP